VGTPEGNKSRKGSVDTREDNIKKRIEEIIWECGLDGSDGLLWTG
jgi:hypothetical protein